MLPMNVNEAIRFIDKTRNIPTINHLLIGPAGSGKTTSILKYAAENDRFVVSLILSQLDATDSLGIPIKSDMTHNDEDISVMATAYPRWLLELAEHDDDPNPPILFLDEFTRGAPDVVNSMLNLITSREVGPFCIKRTQIVAASNIESHTFDLSDAARDRFLTTEIEIDKQELVSFLADRYPDVQRVAAFLSGVAAAPNSASSIGHDSYRVEAFNSARGLSPRNAEALVKLAQEFGSAEQDAIEAITHAYHGYTNLPAPQDLIDSLRSDLVFTYSWATGQSCLQASRRAYLEPMIKAMESYLIPLNVMAPAGDKRVVFVPDLDYAGQIVDALCAQAAIKRTSTKKVQRLIKDLRYAFNSTSSAKNTVRFTVNQYPLDVTMSTFSETQPLEWNETTKLDKMAPASEWHTVCTKDDGQVEESVTLQVYLNALFDEMEATL